MQYTCANCDHTFEADDDKVRCPKCLRKHGLIPVEDGDPKAAAKGAPKADPDPPGPRGKLYVGVGVGLAIVVAAAIGFYKGYFRGKPEQGSRNVTLGPVSAKTLKDVARRRGTPVDTIYHTADAAIRAAGKRLGADPDGGKVAAALLKEVRGTLGPKGVRVRRSGRLKNSALLTAPQLYKAIRDKEVVTVYSYELACLYLALARAAGLHAVLAEIYHHTDQKGPADPLGHVGHFGVAIYKSGAFKGRPAMVVDPARGTLNAAKEYEVLTDLRAVAHGMALHGMQLAEVQNEVATAVETLDAALRLAPRAATILGAKGMFLLKSGGVAPAMDAFRAARGVREDAPRFLLLALGYQRQDQAKGVLGRAMSEMDQAISRDPDYALAYVMKADLLLRQGKVDEATSQLDKAQALQPNNPEALQARALILLSTQKTSQGLALLRRAVALDPLDEQARFQLWRSLLMLEQKEEAAKAAKAWLAMIPSAKRAQTVDMMDRFKKMFDKYKAQQAPTDPGEQDPFKLKMPGQGGGGVPGSPGTSPFPGQDKQLQL